MEVSQLKGKTPGQNMNWKQINYVLFEAGGEQKKMYYTNK